MVYGEKNSTQLVKKHRNLDTGIDFVYVTPILLFFTVNHKLPYERNRKLPYERNKNYVHTPCYCHGVVVNQDP